MTPKLISVGRAAAILGVSRQTVYNWIEAGELDHYRVGPRGLYRVDLADVHKLSQVAA